MPILQALSALALLVCAFGPDARAAALPEVAVVGLHVPGTPEDEARATNDALVAALDATGKVDAVGPDEVARRIAGREPLILAGIFLGPGQKLLDEGRILLERADPDGAVQTLERAVSALRDGMAATTDNRAFLEALLLLGVARATIGENDKARSAFEEVILFDPGRELDRVNYPPRIVDLFTEVRLEMQRAGSGALIVNASQPGAQVFVDGRDAGRVPASVSGLLAGEHYVLVLGDKGHRNFEAVSVQSGKTTPLHVSLETRTLAEPAENDRERSRQVRELYRSLGEHVQTDLVLVGGLSTDRQLTLQLYSARAGSFSKIISVDPGGNPGAAAVDVVASLASFPTSTGDLRGDKVSVQIPPLDIDANPVLSDLLLDPEPQIRVVTERSGLRWYVWAGAGALVAGGAAGLTLSLIGGESDDGQHGTIVFGPIP
jgi:tetratricopeptide (TPR) repeat protein